MSGIPNAEITKPAIIIKNSAFVMPFVASFPPPAKGLTKLLR